MYSNLFFVGHLAEEFPLGAVPNGPSGQSHMQNSSGFCTFRHRGWLPKRRNFQFGEIPPQDGGGISFANRSLAHGNDIGAEPHLQGSCVFSMFSSINMFCIKSSIQLLARVDLQALHCAFSPMSFNCIRVTDWDVLSWDSHPNDCC